MPFNYRISWENHGTLTSTDDVDNSNDGAEVEDDSLDDEPVSTDRESEFCQQTGNCRLNWMKKIFNHRYGIASNWLGSSLVSAYPVMER